MEEINFTAKRHPNSSNKHDQWILDVQKKNVIIGDSNLSHIPPFRQTDLQIDSYPGAKFQHAVSLLKKVKINPEVEVVLLSFGINERSRMPTIAQQDMELALTTAKIAFPAAKIIVPLVTFSERLKKEEKLALWGLNSAIAAQNCLPPLPYQDFKTQRDNIHWTGDTGKKMLEHWLAHLT